MFGSKLRELKTEFEKCERCIKTKKGIEREEEIASGFVCEIVLLENYYILGLKIWDIEVRGYSIACTISLFVLIL